MLKITRPRYKWPCPRCMKPDNGKMDEKFIVTCACGCQYDGLLNAAQWKKYYKKIATHKGRIKEAIVIITKVEQEENNSDLREAISILNGWL